MNQLHLSTLDIQSFVIDKMNEYEALKFKFSILDKTKSNYIEEFKKILKEQGDLNQKMIDERLNKFKSINATVIEFRRNLSVIILDAQE